MSTQIELSEGLQWTIALEQRAISEGAVNIDRNCNVNNLDYLTLRAEPSILITPNSYKDGKILANIPNNNAVDLDCTRGSIDWSINADGNLQRMPYNLAAYSEPTQASETTISIDVTYQSYSWDIGLSGTSVFFVDNSTLRAFGSGHVTNGKNYTIMCFIEMADGSEPQVQELDASPDLRLQISGTASGIVVEKYNIPNTNIWVCKGNNNAISTTTNNSVVKLGSHSNKPFNCTGLSVLEGNPVPAQDYLQYYLQTNGGLNTPNISYPYGGASQGCPFIWCQDQATNKVTDSEDISQLFFSSVRLNDSGTPPYLNVFTAPDGTMSADKMIANTVNSTHEIRYDISTNIGDEYTASVFVHKAEYEYFRLIVLDGDTFATIAIVNVNLNDGSVGGSLSGDYKVEDLKNGYYRISITYDATFTSMQIRHNVMEDFTTSSFVGNDSNGLYVWGFNHTDGGLSSYVKASGGIETRFRDILLNSNAASFVDNSKGSLYCHFIAQESTDNAGIISLDQGVSTNRVQINTGGTFITFSLRDSDVGFKLNNTQPIVLGSENKALITWDSSTIKAYLNGSLVANNIIAHSLSGITNYRLGNIFNNSTSYQAKGIKFYKNFYTDKVLTIAEGQEITTL